MSPRPVARTGTRMVPLIGQGASSRNVVCCTFMLLCDAHLLPGPVCRKRAPVMAGRFQERWLEELLEQEGVLVNRPGACLPRSCTCSPRMLRACDWKAEECRGLRQDRWDYRWVSSSIAESKRDVMVCRCAGSRLRACSPLSPSAGTAVACHACGGRY